MNFTLEQLEKMPMNILQGIDIKTKEEEDLVQEVLNRKRMSLPIKSDLNITSSMTDNITVEKERELQAQIDARKAEIRKSMSQPVIKSEDEIVPDMPIIEPTVEPDKPEEPVITAKKFCEFCDSKGVRHKKECTRLAQKNV